MLKKIIMINIFTNIAAIVLFAFGAYQIYLRSINSNISLMVGMFGLILLFLSWWLQLKRKFWVKMRTVVAIQIYFFLRWVLLLISIYILLGKHFFNAYEVVIGYFLLLLISLFSIKNDKNFRSLDR